MKNKLIYASLFLFFLSGVVFETEAEAQRLLRRRCNQCRPILKILRSRQCCTNAGPCGTCKVVYNETNNVWEVEKDCANPLMCVCPVPIVAGDGGELEISMIKDCTFPFFAAPGNPYPQDRFGLQLTSGFDTHAFRFYDPTTAAEDIVMKPLQVGDWEVVVKICEVTPANCSGNSPAQGLPGTNYITLQYREGTEDKLVTIPFLEQTPETQQFSFGRFHVTVTKN